MSKFTGPQIHVPGGHIHEIETALGVEDDTDFTYFNPGSYEIGQPSAPFYEIGARASNKLIKIPKHTRGWPGFPEYEVAVQAHTRHYPDVWGEVPSISHYEMGASVPSIPHYEVGARASNKLIKIAKHTRGWPGFPEYEVPVQAHTRHYPDVWGEETYTVGRLEIGAASRAFDIDPPRLTGKIRTFVKKGKLIAMARVFVPSTGGSMVVAIRIPLSTIRKFAPNIPEAHLAGEFDAHGGTEIGWSWKKYVKKAFKKTIHNPAFKLIAKKSNLAAKYISNKASKVAANPNVQKFAGIAAVAVGTAYGIPPQVTMAATGVLFNAMNGDETALNKVVNIASQAAEGNETAKKMKALMGILYKGGMREMKPYLIKAQQAGIAKFAQTSEQMKHEISKTLPSQFALPGKAPGMFPFVIPGFSYGPVIGGWLYNIPYRSNLAALSADRSNPFDLLRGAYSKGME